MKNLKKIILPLFFITQIFPITLKKTSNPKTARKSMTVVPTGTTEGHNYSTSQTTHQTPEYIQIPSTHPCYQNCMNSLKTGSPQTHEQVNAQGVPKNNLNQYPDEQYNPTGFTGMVYNGLNNVIEGTSALVGSTYRGGAQLQMSVLKSQNDIAKTQMELNQQQRMSDLEYQNGLNKKEIEVQNEVYDRESQSPVYGGTGYVPEPYQNAVHGSQAYLVKKII